MSLWGDIKQFVSNVAQGNLGAAVGDVGQGISDLAGGGNTSQSDEQSEIMQKMLEENAANNASQTPATCCNRYQYSDGFLVDGVSGTIWKYDQKSNAFTEVPIAVNQDRQKLIGELIENRLNDFKRQYEQEFLSTVSVDARAKKLQEFDKDHLDLVRKVASRLRF